MKTVKFFLGAIALAAVSMIASPAVNAQENGNRDENGKVVRGPYLTNGFGDNWFVAAAGGVNLLIDNGFEVSPALAVDVNVGKWITPSVGVRLGYSGVKGSAWSPDPTWLGSTLNKDRCAYQQKWNSTYIHTDFLWNVSNAWGGYKETRFWSFIPYAHAGWICFNGPKGSGGDEELGYGIGLLNALRLSDRVDLTIDLRATVMNARIHGGFMYATLFTPTLGVSVDLGKNNWVRASNWHNPVDTDAIAAAEASAAALAAANAALAADNKNLKDENSALAAKNKALADENACLAANQGIQDIEPAAFYFEIGQTKLSAKELAHLDFYMNNVLPNVKNKKVTIITGSADKKTGTTRRNQQLCEKRAQYLQNLLAEKYGVDTNGFEVNTNISAEGNPELQRAVIISFE